MEALPLVVASLERRLLDLVGFDRHNHIVLLVDGALLNGDASFEPAQTAFRLSVLACDFYDDPAGSAFLFVPPPLGTDRPSPMAQALERWCQHSGGMYHRFSGMASDWLGGPYLDQVIDLNRTVRPGPIRARSQH